MEPYRLKVMHVEDDIINFSTIIQYRNYYPWEDNNGSDEYSMVILNDGILCDTVISDNIYIISNNIPKIINSDLSSLQTGCAKYRIYSIK